MRPLLAALLALAFVLPVQAAGASMPGMGTLSGTVTVAKPVGQLTVYAFNTEKRVGYMVYVVDGRYRITQLFPGPYEVTLRGTPGQRNWDLPRVSRRLRIAAGRDALADFRYTATDVPPTYVGGMPYPNAQVVPYDLAYPPGPGRDVVERVCFGCHTSSFYPYNVVRTYPGGRPPHDREGWALTVDRMAHGHAFNAKDKASYFDPLLLSPAERDAVVDYLAQNFGPDSAARVVQQDSDPALDPQALARAQFVEYRFLNVKGEDDRFTHTPDFDGHGNVWIMDRGASSLVKVEPSTARVTDHKGHGGGEFLTVDVDGTVWYGGLSHYDPRSNLHDEYRFEWKQSFRAIPISSLIIDSRGDIWLSLLPTGGLARFDRKGNTVDWWDVPVLRSRPYGIILDRDDKVWFANYHNSGVTRFDPATGSFRNYPLTLGAPTNIRRLTVDSQNRVWSATWGSRALQNGALYRLDPQSGAVEEFRIGIPYTNPYDVEVDAADNVWIATDNHVLRFDPVARRFTNYPVTTRTDIPKLAVTRDGAVWFGPRNAGQSGGYGGAATVLYPDKDRIESFDAYYAPDNPRARKARYQGPPTPVAGTMKLVPAAAQNPCEFERSVGLGDGCTGTAPGPHAAPATINGGAARE
ncbi:MAG: hypothetical protein U1F11_04195 [Steroidobacteraceae bacterium]